MQKLEDEEDLQEALLALKEVEEQGSVPFDEMKKRNAFKPPKITVGAHRFSGSLQLNSRHKDSPKSD